MSDWGRKHLCELAYACKPYKDDETLSVAQRKAFAVSFDHARNLAQLPNAGGSKSLMTAINMVCNACKSISRHECAGRTDWVHPCSLLPPPI